MQAAAMHTGVPKILSVNLFGDREARARSMLKLTTRELDWWALEQAKKQPRAMNARQYFMSALADTITAPSSVTPTTTQTSIFSPYTDCTRYLPVGFGTSAPYPGQIYEFALGGLITTPATGTLVITPFMGQGASATVFTAAVNLGASPAQTVTASLSNIPWEMSGHLVFRTISTTASSSTCWLTGTFRSQGTLATAGAGWTIPFGSTAAVTVDTTGVANASGGITFTVTFSVTGATIITEWTKMLTCN
jgi:hypothetical protein